ncbi:hypothetical protein GCM10029963_48480 [Micromonospora andamanensis]
MDAPGTGLIVERESATLTHTDDAYRCVIRRELYNAGVEPVTRYLIRVAVDRYPSDPGRSNRHHREHPLSFAELQLVACREESGERETMHWRAKHDRDAFKEIWLLFENGERRFPLYPGRRATIEYAYTVGQDKWGPWFQRAVRVPTRHLAVRLDLPAALDPQVWGAETSLSAEEGPLRTAVTRSDEGDRAIFDWATDEPPLNARYRLQWRFRAQPEPDVDGGRVRPSDRMRGLGIVQRGADLLRQPTRPFDLPREEPVAREIVDRLLTALARLDELHPFTKGWASPPHSSTSTGPWRWSARRTAQPSRSCCSIPGWSTRHPTPTNSTRGASPSSIIAAWSRDRCDSTWNTRSSTADGSSRPSSSAWPGWSRTRSTTWTAGSTSTGWHQACRWCRSRSTASPATPGATDRRGEAPPTGATPPARVGTTAGRARWRGAVQVRPIGGPGRVPQGQGHAPRFGGGKLYRLPNVS